MGAWGIRERQSDYGLDLLGTIVGTQLKAVDFAIFNTSEAIELLRQDIMEDIKRTNRGCPPEGLDCYINANFPRDFTHAALLIAECLADYYRTGELIVTEYVGKSCKASRTRSVSYINAGSVMIPASGGWPISGLSSKP